MSKKVLNCVCARLQLTVLNHSVFGEYKCRASNSLGSLERVVVLHEGRQPSTPEMQVRAAMPDALSVELQAASEELNFQGPAALDVTSFKVQVKRKDEYDWNAARTYEFPSGKSLVKLRSNFFVCELN